MASALFCCAIWMAGIAWWWQGLSTLFVLRYWWVWHEDLESPQWLLLYPDKVLLGMDQGRIVTVPQPLPLTYLGVCCVLHKQVLWRDQVPEQYWRALQVLVHWPLTVKR